MSLLILSFCLDLCMQNKLHFVISKIDDEIEHRISSDKEMNSSTFDAYNFIRSNIHSINKEMKQYSLNERHAKLKEYLVSRGYVYKEKSLALFLLKNGYFNDKAKIFFNFLLPIIIAIIVALIVNYKMNNYFMITFINVTIIFSIFINALFSSKPNIE